MFDIQQFAEGGEGTADAPVDTGDNTPADDAKVETDDVQSKIDAAVAAQLTKMQAKFEADLKKREELAKKEAERLSKLSDDERQKAELENTRKELEKQKSDFEREKLKYEAAKVLSQRNLPVDFVDYLIAADNESTLENIKVFEKKFNKAVDEAVTAKLKGKAPQISGKNLETSSSSFMKAIYDSQINI